MKPIKSGVYENRDLANVIEGRTTIAFLLEKGFILEVLPGSGYFHTADIEVSVACILIAQKYFPDAVFSKITLLSHYSLTSESNEKIDLDVFGGPKVSGVDELFRFHNTRRAKDPVVMGKINGIEIKCYSVERAVFEVLFLEDKDLGLLAGEVAFNYVRNHPYNAEQLRLIASTFGERGGILFRLIQLVERGLSPY